MSIELHSRSFGEVLKMARVLSEGEKSEQIRRRLTRAQDLFNLPNFYTELQEKRAMWVRAFEQILSEQTPA